MSRNNQVPVSCNDEQPVLKLKPEVTIRGQPMEVVSVVDDGHGVMWVCVEPAVQYQRLRTSVRRQMAIQQTAEKAEK